MFNAENFEEIMKKSKHMEGISENKLVIRSPLYLPVFYLIMALVSLSLWLFPSSTDSRGPHDILIDTFHFIFGFPIWIPTTIIFSVLAAVKCYKYFRFKLLVIHEQSFSVVPLFGESHDVAFSSVETVINSKKFSRDGFYIEIVYGNKKIRIPYSVNTDGTFRQKNIAVLLERLENHTTIIATEGLGYPFK